MPAVAGLAQPSTVARVVGVEAGSNELPPVERVVVGVDTGRLPAQHAHGIAGEHAGPEPLLVPLAVATLSRAAASLLGCAPVFLAAPALVGELWAAGGGAHPPACPSRHRGSPFRHTVCVYEGGVLCAC